MRFPNLSFKVFYDDYWECYRHIPAHSGSQFNPIHRADQAIIFTPDHKWLIPVNLLAHALVIGSLNCSIGTAVCIVLWIIHTIIDILWRQNRTTFTGEFPHSPVNYPIHHSPVNSGFTPFTGEFPHSPVNYPIHRLTQGLPHSPVNSPIHRWTTPFTG